jgi:hypothetical protein
LFSLEIHCVKMEGYKYSIMADELGNTVHPKLSSHILPFSCRI